MKAHKRLMQAMADSRPTFGPEMPVPVATKQKLRIFVDEVSSLSSGFWVPAAVPVTILSRFDEKRPPGCHRRGGKWVRR